MARRMFFYGNISFRSRNERIVDFKRWITHDVIPSLRKTGSYSIHKSNIMTPIEAVNQVIDVAAKFQEVCAVKKGIALVHAINLVEPVYGNTLEPFRKLLPPAEHETSC